ncbi:recombination regulator RecX [Tenuibacillus multivorans]|uniref:Regulatory protein RecX n=1 Tax=Tenuibacillus multivorans TaxID=237069 RepID=A0A1H0FYY9_9BACI|nr:recombination regulator RecX [Tenuibacillus multivorans]GEL78156.1 regulatory protein RecX [Tenuibacillus multivorans]SDN99719.1 regulatory protein [Tenuibacillus multivorans]
MKISKITTQKKNKNRFNIFISKNGADEYAFSVHEDILIRHYLRKDMELSDEQIKELKEQDAIYQYYTLSINYLSYRMRAKSEIIQYLKEKEASDEAIEVVIKKLEEEKLVNDLAFSQAYVRTKMNTTSKGPNKIRQELMQKKIPQSYIDKALTEYKTEIEADKVIGMMEKKLSGSRKKSYKQQMMQLKQSLMQKGFTQEAIEMASQEVDVTVDEDEEMEALRYQGEKIWNKQARKHEGFQLRQKVMGSLYQKGFSMDLINQFLDEKEEGL